MGWTRGASRRDVYVRQLREMKMSATIEDLDFDIHVHTLEFVAGVRRGLANGLLFLSKIHSAIWPIPRSLSSLAERWRSISFTLPIPDPA